MESKGIQIIHVFKGLFLCFMPKPEKKSERFAILMMKSWKSNMQADQGSVRALLLTNLKAYQVNWKQN